MDWVLYSQFLGKFRKLQDADKSLSENINRVFQRDGIISEETKPSEFQLTWTSDRQMIFKIGSVCVKIPAFPRSDAWIALNLMEDDVIYHLNDYAFCEQCTKFGKIIGLYRINAEQWIDLEIMEGLNIDSESGISFASIDSDRFKKMVKM